MTDILNFLKIVLQEETMPLIKLPSTSDNLGPCRLIQFYQLKEKNFCAVVTKNNEINILEVNETGPDVLQTIEPLENKSKMKLIGVKNLPSTNISKMLFSSFFFSF